MGLTNDKLERLRAAGLLKTGADLQAEQAQAPAKPRPLPTPPPDTTGRLRDEQDRWARLRERIAHRQPAEETEHAAETPPDRHYEPVGAPARALAEAVPGEIIGDPDDGFYLVRRDFPLHHAHGRVALGDLLNSRAEHFAFSACDAELHDFDPRTACFVDTETSGLAGGAGTVAFLIGVGYFTDDAFRLDQCFLRDYEDEEAMLAFLAERFAQCETLVSYNGKSFDQPLLRTRFVQQRIPFRLEAAAHLDLVHVARRVWKRRLRDCSLGNIEREVLGIERVGDVPSYLIPQIWFNFLHTGDAAPLEGVFYHHRMDILSLVAVAAHLAECLETPDGAGFQHREDRLSIVRLHHRQKHHDQVVALGKAFLVEDPASPLRAECLAMIAHAAQTLRDWPACAHALETWAAEYPESVDALIALAKHLEHRARDPHRAATLVQQALATPQAQHNPALAQALQHRLNRLQRRTT
jgi:uncharacterized protein YprB with RNaseH-like and TPR domain